MAQKKLNQKEVDELIEKVLLSSAQRFTQLVSFSTFFFTYQTLTYCFSQVGAEMIKALCTTATEVLKNQPSFVEVQPPVVICGDIHGQFSDLLRIFNTVGFPPAKNFLFLGGKFFIKLLISDLSYGFFFCRLRGPWPTKH